VRSSDLAGAVARIRAKKEALHLHNEVKWGKVSHAYLEKYKALVDEIFDMLEAGIIKIRIMFTQNLHVPVGLSESHLEDQYFILYYQFLRHAFGLQYANDTGGEIHVRLNLDQLPDNRERANRFKSYVCQLSTFRAFRQAKIKVDREQIADVVSHKHDLLQALDIVLGAMQFRLNDKHLEKPPGKRRRGKTTIAKERLYRHINARIQKLRGRLFNIGANTSNDGDPANRWRHPYRHWLFTPKRRVIAVGRGKPRNQARRRKKQ
jgi:hypothetical protein